MKFDLRSNNGGLAGLLFIAIGALAVVRARGFPTQQDGERGEKGEGT